MSSSGGGSSGGRAGEVRSTSGAHGILEYEVQGSGTPVVMLHGAFAGRGAWSRQRKLAERWRLVLPSARAHDGSARELPAGYGIATTDVDDLKAVLAAEGLERFDLIAHSSGGATAVAFVRAHPEAVRRLVLIEPTLLKLLPPEEHAVMQREWGRLVEIARRDGGAAGLSAAMAWLGREAWARLEDGRRTKLLADMAPLAHITGPHFQALLDFAVAPIDVTAIKAPTLLIYGSASYPFEDKIAARLRALKPDWPLVSVEGAGHNCFREQPDLVNAAIADFLSR